MKGLIPLLGLALLLPSTAQAEVVAPGVSEGALAVARDGSPRVAWLEGRRLMLANRGASWRPSSIATLPTTDGRIAGLAENAVLVEARRSWIRLVVRSGSRWRVLVVADAPKRTLLGVSGLALDASGLPAAAYALQEANNNTSLHLVRLAPNGRLARTRITQKGFPTSVVPPAAAPVLWPDGTIRVVQSFSQRGANAILWRRQGKRWWGRVLHASAFGAAPLPLYVAAAADGVHVAWTIPYLTFSENHLVLSTRVNRSTSLVLHPNAFAAGLVLGASGPEVAANESVQGLVAGFVTGGAQSELDGRVLGYAATPIGGRQLLLARPRGLEWFELPVAPAVQVTVDFTLRGRVETASSGSVSLYEEQAGQPRRLVGEFPLDEQGLFDASAASITPGFSYRAVYVDSVTGVPYARLMRP